MNLKVQLAAVARIVAILDEVRFSEPSTPSPRLGLRSPNRERRSPGSRAAS